MRCRWIWLGLTAGVLACAAFAQDTEPQLEAPAELEQARAAIEQEDYFRAMHHLARVQVFYANKPDWLPAALYYEALIDLRTDAQPKLFSALDELIRFFPKSEWTRRAQEELMKDKEMEGDLK